MLRRFLTASLSRATPPPPPSLFLSPKPLLPSSLSPNHNPNRLQMSSSSIPDLSKSPRADLLRSLSSSLGGPSFSSSPLTPPPPPLILVISGPSGVGKDALISSLRLRNPSLHFVVTATSRPIRPNETHGRDYLFFSKQQFLTMINNDELLEYALVYGDYKGIPKQQIREALAKGSDVVLRVDVQGAETLRRILEDGAVFVFLVAESEEKLVERLVDRKTESKESLMVRVATAREEVKRVERFDYVVVNKEGRLEEAVELVESIVRAEKARVKPRRSVI